MDWENLNADVNKILNVHYSSGRFGRSIEHVVIHYNAGNLTVEGCYSVWQSREASAHYQVEDDGRIGQLVWDRDTAWHAGNWNENCRSIGVEHANQSDGTVTEVCLDAGAHLVAAICRYYGLGRPEWRKNVFPHWDFQSTSCPGELGRSQNAAYMQRAHRPGTTRCAERRPHPRAARLPAIPAVRRLLYVTSTTSRGASSTASSATATRARPRSASVTPPCRLA